MYVKTCRILHIHILLQVYPEGRLSQIMKHLNIGEELQFKGPKGRFEYDVNERRALGEDSSALGSDKSLLLDHCHAPANPYEDAMQA